MNFEKPSVVLCEDDKSALDLYNILISIYPQDNICYFPAHDSLPFSEEKSSKEILLERSFQLIKLQKQNIIIISCNNLLKKFLIQHDSKHYLKLDVNQEISLNEINIHGLIVTMNRKNFNYIKKKFPKGLLV